MFVESEILYDYLIKFLIPNLSVFFFFIFNVYFRMTMILQVEIITCLLKGQKIKYCFTFNSTPPKPLLLKITHRIPTFFADETRHLIYSAWLAPVSPGKIITIGETAEHPSSAQSKATSPPSDKVRISLRYDYRLNWI